MAITQIRNKIADVFDAEAKGAHQESRSWLARAALGLIWFYQSAISPFTPKACRYQPTCSHYASEAIVRYGIRRGGVLAAKRICRCTPWGSFGFDPVPDLDAHDLKKAVEYSSEHAKTVKTESVVD